jgi:peroxiredoxin Q/BCP
MPTLHTGDPAPLFHLKDEQGNEVSLAQFKDTASVVLIFYPGDMTPGCTMQLCSIRDEWKTFKEKNILVFGVNAGSAKSHQKFKETFRLPYPLLIDEDKKVSEAYDALFSFFGIKIIRRTVIGIDKNGTVRYMKRGMPRTSDILKAMQKYS